MTKQNSCNSKSPYPSDYHTPQVIRNHNILQIPLRGIRGERPQMGWKKEVYSVILRVQK